MHVGRKTQKREKSAMSVSLYGNLLFGITLDELLYGNLLYNPTEYQTDIDLLMADCSKNEKRFIFLILSAVKDILRSNDWSLIEKILLRDSNLKDL